MSIEILMNRKIFLSMLVLSVAVLPAVATAAVLVNNPVATHTNNTHSNPVYLAEAPGYSSAKDLGYIGLSGGGSTSTGQTLYLNGTPGAGNITLVNVLEVVNATSTSYSSAVTLYFNGTLPSGVSIYYSTSAMGYSGTSITGGTKLSTGVPVHLDSQHIYLSFVLLGSISSGSTTLNMQVSYQ